MALMTPVPDRNALQHGVPVPGVRAADHQTDNCSAVPWFLNFVGSIADEGREIPRRLFLCHVHHPDKSTSTIMSTTCYTTDTYVLSVANGSSGWCKVFINHGE